MRGGAFARRPRPLTRLALAAAVASWLAFPALAAPPGRVAQAGLLDGQPAREAVASAAKRLEENPSDGAARLLRARARIALGDLAAARADVDEALRRAPGWPQALAVESLVLLAEGRKLEAVDAARRAVEAGPREKWASYALGRALLDSGNTKGGLAALERATKLDPVWVGATIERAKVREELGDRQGALADYERVLLLEPASRTALDARDRIQRGTPDSAVAAPDTVVAKPSVAIAAAPRDTAIRPAGPSPPGVAAGPTPAPQASPPAPFEPGALPAELRLLAPGGPPPPANIPPFLDLNDLSAATWGGAVSAAKEAMRLVIGPMGPGEEKAFDDTWTPLFRFPHEKLVDWLNALNPLLGQYLATRASAAEAVLGFDAAQLEAAAAAGARGRRGGRGGDAVRPPPGAAPRVARGSARGDGAADRGARAPARPGRGAAGGGRRSTRRRSASSTTSPSRGRVGWREGGVTQIKLLKRFPDGKVLFWNGPKSALEAAASQGIDTSKPGMDYSEGRKGMVIVPGIWDLIVAAEPLPDGRLVSTSWSLCPMAPGLQGGRRQRRGDGVHAPVPLGRLDRQEGRLRWTRGLSGATRSCRPGRAGPRSWPWQRSRGPAKAESHEKTKTAQAPSGSRSYRAGCPSRRRRPGGTGRPRLPPRRRQRRVPKRSSSRRTRSPSTRRTSPYFQSQVAAAERDVAGARTPPRARS